MQNTIQTDNMPRLAEYGSAIARANRADKQTLATKPGAMHNFHPVSFGFSTAGYECAGSMMRFTNSYWFVTYEIDGSTFGKRFAEVNEDAARAYFAKITDDSTVSMMRSEAAERATADRRSLVDANFRADAYTVEAAKTYRSAWQWKANFPGFGEWMGYHKTKAEALAAARAAIVKELRYLA